MKRMMIVDDSTVIRRRIERTHGLDNYVVVGSASDGLQAVEVARQRTPDLITIDLTMPNMDGIDAIPILAEVCPGARILVVSALADKATAIRALSRGAHGFLCKPFTDDELRDALHELVSD
ncbi:response regulator [Marinobacterium zhoushanense]|uniref:Response regulator n=1 Tax=Marinobacterium zhoushanense TaxID=1679163 RepID=A0ABQ1K9M9_9GAMM|nr:response regulator [Marinobacterium zhoushanense]GGB91117.1 response regulator [Marinobacterium zhoushanense]